MKKMLDERQKVVYQECFLLFRTLSGPAEYRSLMVIDVVNSIYIIL